MPGAGLPRSGMTIPRLIHQTAATHAVSPEERRLRRRAQRLLPGWRFRLWDDADNQALMARHFPALAARFAAIRRGVVRADIARCAFLHAQGGWYMDTDYKLLRPFDPALLQHACVLPISRDDDPASPGFRVCNSIMASVPGYPLWADFITGLFDRHTPEALDEGAVELVTGPEGLTAFMLAHRDRYPGIHTPPRRAFHPPITAHGLSYDKRHSSYGAHLCWGSWRSTSPLRAAKTLLVRKVTSFT